MDYKDVVWSSVVERLDRAISYSNCNKVYKEQNDSRLTAPAGVAKRRYPYIPFHMGTFVDEMDALRQIFGPKRMRSMPKFIDVGCGVGTKLAIASQFGFNCYGIELDAELARIAINMNFRVEVGDAIEADYSAYDAIYFYCPIRDVKLEAKLEKRIIDTAKPGALIVGNMKCGDVPDYRKRVWGSKKVELVANGSGDRYWSFEIHRKR